MAFNKEVIEVIETKDVFVGDPKAPVTLMQFGDSAQCVLGNHDLHLLAVAFVPGQRLRRSDTLDDILASPDRPALLDWLRHGKLADMAHGWLLVHAGVVPQWTTTQTLALAAEVQLCGMQARGLQCCAVAGAGLAWQCYNTERKNATQSSKFGRQLSQGYQSLSK